MTENKTLDHAKEDLEEGKSPSTAVGEFVREEMHHIREASTGLSPLSKRLPLAYRRPGVRASAQTAQQGAHI
jgi:hypothetical protein